MRIQLDYYRILGLTPSAKLDQIDLAHGDRIKSLPRREYSDKAISVRQKLLDVAHTVLADTSQRQVYDAQILPKLIKSKDEHAFFIEIDQRELAGAFLILYELGEYDQIIELSKNAVSLDSSDRDLILSTVLAYLELGRENWNQGKYESAAKNFEKGISLVEKSKDEGAEKSELFPEIKQELQRNICQLQPYQILELMSSGSTTRGISLLKQLLDLRQGIDGKGDDRTGLNIDKFLQFILELRVYMTSSEQEALFADESRRPSLVASYLEVYALIAKGISQSQPALIRHSKNLLKNISRSQNVYLEEAICALLLGQVEEAITLLNKSNEAEKIALIHQMSDSQVRDNQSDRQTESDLFEGLYGFTQTWLGTEIYPHFKDLIGQSVNLEAYFNNQNVQAYINQLPTPNRASQIFAPVAIATISDPVADSIADSISEPPISIFRRRDRLVESQKLQVEPNSSEVTASRVPRSRSKVDRRPKYRFNSKRLILFLVSLASVIGGAVALGYVVSNFINASNKELVVQSEPVLSPIINTSVANIKPIKVLAPNLSEAIDQKIAGEIVTNWQKIKAEALGRKYKVNELEQILAEPLLSEWRSRAENLKSSSSYLEYTLKSAVVEEFNSTKDRASVLTDISEVRNYFTNGQLNRDDSKADNYKVEYVLSKVGDRWLISAMNLKPSRDP